MKQIWKFTNRFFKGDSVTGLFLTLNIVAWAFITLVLGLFFCTVGGSVPIAVCITNVMCMAVYAGIIIGLFGGIIFLMRDGK